TQRDKNITEFQNSAEPLVILGTIDAMGETVTLTAARTVIFCDRSWVPAVNEQAWSRTVRRGQEGLVTVIDLVARGTIEDEIAKLNRAKEKLAENVLTPRQLYELWKSEKLVVA